MIRILNKLNKHYHIMCKCGAVIECDDVDLIKLYTGCEYSYQWGIKCPCCDKNLYKTDMDIVYDDISYTKEEETDVKN